MKIINNELLHCDGSLERVFLVSGNGVGDTVSSELYVNPLSDCSIAVKGYVSEEDTEGVTLKSVDIANLVKMDSITSAGNYLFIIGSYCKVKVSITGNADVAVKYLY